MENVDNAYDPYTKPSESNDLDNDFSSRSKSKNDNQAKIGHSGNSNVDVNVNVEIDTTAIAYAILCSSLAKKELTNEEFEFALKKLENLMSKNKERDRIIKKKVIRDKLFRIW